MASLEHYKSRLQHLRDNAVSPEGKVYVIYIEGILNDWEEDRERLEDEIEKCSDEIQFLAEDYW